MDKTALITGIRGQDASYISDILLEKGYRVVGIMRRTVEDRLNNIQHIINSDYFRSGQFIIHYGDLLDQPSIASAFRLYQPDECYHLAAMSFVGDSWTQPEVMCETTGMGTLRVLEALRQWSPHTRFYFAGSSEMFGRVVETPQRETTPFYPRSPYGVAKVLGFYLTRNYRESYGFHASSGILFNHESPRRSDRFVTRKVTKYVAQVALGLNQGKLKLGNLDAQRDWGHAKDYMEAAWMMLQQEQSDEYVISTGSTHSISYLLKVAFEEIDRQWRDYVEVDESLLRPAEVEILLGNATKAKEKLGWIPKVSFEDLIHEMVENDIQLLQN